MPVTLSNVENGIEIHDRCMKFMHCETGFVANKIDNLLEIRQLILFQISCSLILFIRVK